MLEPFASMEQWYRKGRRFVLATVVRAPEGSVRGPGALMAVNERGDIAGSVSGGCVEGAVVQAAFEVIDSGIAQTVSFGAEALAADSEAIEAEPFEAGPESFDVDLPCAGSIEVLVRPLDDEVLALMKGARDEGAPRVVCVGAVHIAASLIRLAREAGFRTVVVDPRRAFISSERFDIADERVCDWPQRALPALGLTSNDAVCALSHDGKIDVPAIAEALKAGAGYIGCLGHAETLADRRKALLELGVEESALNRVFGPIGVFIGGREPEEIALSALAQIQAVRYGRIGFAEAMPGHTLDFFTEGNVARIARDRELRRRGVDRREREREAGHERMGAPR